MINLFRTGVLLAVLTALFMGVGYLIGGGSGMMLALLVAAATNLFAYWNADRLVLSMYGARPIGRADAPRLYDLVADLAGHADIPMPQLYLIDSAQPNAFATAAIPATPRWRSPAGCSARSTSMRWAVSSPTSCRMSFTATR